MVIVHCLSFTDLFSNINIEKKLHMLYYPRNAFRGRTDTHFAVATGNCNGRIRIIGKAVQNDNLILCGCIRGKPACLYMLAFCLGTL